MKRLTLIAVVLTCIAVPAFAQSPLEVIQQERAKYGATVAPSEAQPLLRAIAARLPGYGLLVKKSGNNCGGYSCDVICTKTTVYDIFIDGPDATKNLPGKAQPTFNPNSTDMVGTRTCEIVGGPVQPPDSGGNVPDLGPLYAKLDELAARIASLEQKPPVDLRPLDSRISAIDSRLKDVEARPIIVPPCVQGRLWGIFPIRSCPETQLPEGSK